MERRLPDIAAREPTDSDVDLHASRPVRHRRETATLLVVIAVGGALGAVGRYGITIGWPHGPGGFPAATLVINIAGCALIGVLMVLVSDVWTSQRLLRPFLGTGVLGGFTTFSAYAVEVQQLTAGGHAGTALLYLAVTLVAAMLAVWGAATATRGLVSRRLS